MTKVRHNKYLSCFQLLLCKKLGQSIESNIFCLFVVTLHQKMRSRARILLETHKNLSEWKVFDGKEDENNKKVLVLIRADLDHLRCGLPLKKEQYCIKIIMFS